jgi:hypothetical protein
MSSSGAAPLARFNLAGLATAADAQVSTVDVPSSIAAIIRSSEPDDAAA